MYRRIGKRILDLGLTLSALALLLPVMGIVALLVRVNLGHSVIYRQMRPGRGGHPFWILKFRSMEDRRDAGGEPLEDEERLGAFGKWLRKTSLDELPELINVLRGEMSLVGPRPLLMKYLPLYSPRQMRRHDVAPGLTGLAQIHGRNALSWEEKFELDLRYVEEMSLWMDLRILAGTLGVVFSGHGVTAPDSVSAPEFFGSTGYAASDGTGGGCVLCEEPKGQCSGEAKVGAVAGATVGEELLEKRGDGI
jgi:sugar transferase EpsL